MFGMRLYTRVIIVKGGFYLNEKNLKDYIKCYKNFIPKKLCQQTINSLNKKEHKEDFREHTFYNHHIRYEKELSVSWVEIPEKQILQDKIWFAIERYILKDFKHFDWFFGWQGYCEIRFNKYVVDTNMKKHCDHIHSVFDGKIKGVPILSVVGVLNNNYEGGDFIMFEDTKINLPAGSIFIFPSNFLYPHEVSSITKGTRYSFVTWCH